MLFLAIVTLAVLVRLILPFDNAIADDRMYYKYGVLHPTLVSFRWIFYCTISSNVVCVRSLIRGSRRKFSCCLSRVYTVEICTLILLVLTLTFVGQSFVAALSILYSYRFSDGNSKNIPSNKAVQGGEPGDLPPYLASNSFYGLFSHHVDVCAFSF